VAVAENAHQTDTQSVYCNSYNSRTTSQLIQSIVRVAELLVISILLCLGSDTGWGHDYCRMLIGS